MNHPDSSVMQFQRRRFCVCLMLGVLTTYLCQTPASAQHETGKREISVQAVRHSDGDYHFEVSGLDPEQRKDLKIQVWLASVDTEKRPAIAGKTEATDSTICFRPRFRVQTGVEYRIKLVDGSKKNRGDFLVSIPPIRAETTKIESITPTLDRLPANLLKFYLHFSAPMQKGDVYQFVLLRTSDGNPIELPFLELEQELWSRDSKRLTLLLDPGRIKRGLRPREEMGPIFEPGKSYELVIRGDWPDGNGLPLGNDVVKKFKAVEEDYEQPDPKHWKIRIPQASTIDPLVIEFGESLDQAMLKRVIKVQNADGEMLAGESTINSAASQFEFVPEIRWQAAPFKIVVNTNLEDLAGNSIGRQFDVDVFEPAGSGNVESFEEIHFTIN